MESDPLNSDTQVFVEEYMLMLLMLLLNRNKKPSNAQKTWCSSIFELMFSEVFHTGGLVDHTRSLS